MKYCYSREYIVSVSSNFPVPKGHDANFVWNQYEVPQNSREAKKILQYKLSLALKQLRHLAVRVKPISFALRACFLGHYRMARMSQSASPCGLASWMRPHMVPDAHLLKLLFPTRYTSRSIYQSSMCDSQSASSCGLASSIYIAAIYYYDAFLRFPYKIQTSSYSGRIFAQIKRTKNIDSFEKK